MESRSEHIPEEALRWNWGAFLLNILWGIGNRVEMAVLCLIPFLDLIISILLGLRGGKWAWERNEWDSPEAFRKAQKNWAYFGFLSILLGIVLFVLTVVLQEFGPEIPITLVAIMMGYWYWHTASQTEQNRLKWALVGFGLTFLAGFVLGIIVSVYLGMVFRKRYMPYAVNILCAIFVCRIIACIWIGTPLLLSFRLLRPRTETLGDAANGPAHNPP